MLETALSVKKYSVYPEYKESGVEWLGAIPEHWKTISVKYLAELNPKKTGIKTSELDKECTFLPMEKLKLNSLILNETKQVRDVYDGYTYFKDGDFLLAKVTPCFENKNTAIASNLKNGIGFGSSEIYVLRNFKHSHNKYLYYRLQENSFMDIATAAMTGAGGLKRVPADVINSYTLATPSYYEQQKIANFLDHETAKIDTLIAKQEKLIALLKEKRQAVISHAVTRGLNPDAPMKDSGVEWLGEVPEHWTIKRIKNFGLVIGGYAFKSSDFIESGYPVVKISNVSHLEIDWTDKSYLPHEFSEKHKEYIAPKGALVFAMTRPVIAGGIKVFMMGDESKPLINQRVGFINIADENVSSFILQSSLSSSFKAQFINNMTITNQPNISGEGIGNIYIPVPPNNELLEINKELKQIENLYAKLVIKGSEQISLMEERKTALISAAVTGKIDVRDWQL